VNDGIVDVCSFVRHRWPSRLAEDGRWIFASPLYSVMMKQCGCGLRIADYDCWPSRLAEDGRWVFASPLYSVRMKRCGLLLLALQAGRGWVMDLCFLSVFSEDETM
jgi:hypothetical protein